VALDALVYFLNRANINVNFCLGAYLSRLARGDIGRAGGEERRTGVGGWWWWGVFLFNLLQGDELRLAAQACILLLI
jgi:hypothetical protein